MNGHWSFRTGRPSVSQVGDRVQPQGTVSVPLVGYGVSHGGQSQCHWWAIRYSHGGQSQCHCLAKEQLQVSEMTDTD